MVTRDGGDELVLIEQKMYIAYDGNGRQQQVLMKKRE